MFLSRHPPMPRACDHRKSGASDRRESAGSVLQCGNIASTGVDWAKHPAGQFVGRWCELYRI